MTQPANLLIGTPAYGGQVHVDYVSSLLVFQRQGTLTIGNELITRNTRLDFTSARIRTCSFSTVTSHDDVAHDRSARMRRAGGVEAADGDSTHDRRDGRCS
jgi:hypothetical protein